MKNTSLSGFNMKAILTELMTIRSEMVAETGVAHDRSNASLNNMLRFGLRPLYERQNWSWSSARGGNVHLAPVAVGEPVEPLGEQRALGTGQRQALPVAQGFP